MREPFARVVVGGDVDADDVAVRVLGRLNASDASIEGEDVWGLTLDVLVHGVCDLEGTTPTKDQRYAQALREREYALDTPPLHLVASSRVPPESDGV